MNGRKAKALREEARQAYQTAKREYKTIRHGKKLIQFSPTEPPILVNYAQIVCVGAHKYYKWLKKQYKRGKIKVDSFGSVSEA